jgi:hypothetical protein
MTALAHRAFFFALFSSKKQKQAFLFITYYFYLDKHVARIQEAMRFLQVAYFGQGASFTSRDGANMPGLHKRAGLRRDNDSKRHVIMFPTLYEYRVRPYWLHKAIGSDELRWLYQCFKRKLRGGEGA